MAGPLEEDIRYFLFKTNAVTSDFGTEIETVLMPDFLKVLLYWLGGREIGACIGGIKAGERLFPRAIRVAGWSHMYGNLMKSLAKLHPRWPQILAQWRILCEFWRNKTWRAMIQSQLRDEPDVDASILDSFKAGFAKWRYETISDCGEELSKVRFICENKVKKEWFANSQDSVLINKVFEAFVDASMWRFTSVSHRYVFGPAVNKMFQLGFKSNVYGYASL